MPLLSERTYVIAEAGSNHCGALKAAELLVKAAADAGADACKFQLFRLEDILVDPSRGSRQFELPVDYVPKIAGYCREYGIDFLCTPFAPWAVTVLQPYVSMWKIGSFEHKRADVWDACRATGKPIIASDGRGRSPDPDYRLYCVSKYPTLPEDVYLRNIGFSAATLYQGFSDHTLSTVLPALAVARGARIIEKHLRLDDTWDQSPDYPHALTPGQFAEMVSNIRLAELTCRRQPPTEAAYDEYPNRRE